LSELNVSTSPLNIEPNPSANFAAKSEISSSMRSGDLPFSATSVFGVFASLTTWSSHFLIGFFDFNLVSSSGSFGSRLSLPISYAVSRLDKSVSTGTSPSSMGSVWHSLSSNCVISVSPIGLPLFVSCGLSC